MRSHSLRILSLVVVSCFAVLAVPARAGNPASSGVAVAFARVRLSDGVVTAFGGKGTKSVETGPIIGGVGIAVFFTGRYPKSLTRDQVVVQATAEADEAGEFAAANAIVAGASRDGISVTVNAWDTSSGAALDGYVFLTLFSGLDPED